MEATGSVNTTIHEQRLWVPLVIGDGGTKVSKTLRKLSKNDSAAHRCKMTKHERLLAEAKAAIDRLFSDTSVAKETTRQSLEELREEISDRLGSLS